MALCSKCQDRNPASPVYSKAKPVSNENCESCGLSLFGTDFQSNQGQGRNTILVAGNLIELTDIGNSNTDSYIISVIEYLDLTVALTVAPFDDGDNPLSGIILWGTIVDRLDISWVYNKPIVTQSLSNNQGLDPPNLGTVDFSYQYLATNIVNSNIQFTIQGDDGGGQPGSIATDVANIVYGNYRAWGQKRRLLHGLNRH
jgi:hypothetical protein